MNLVAIFVVGLSLASALTIPVTDTKALTSSEATLEKRAWLPAGAAPVNAAKFENYEAGRSNMAEPHPGNPVDISGPEPVIKDDGSNSNGGQQGK